MIKCSAKSLIPTWHTLRLLGMRRIQNNVFERQFGPVLVTCTLLARYKFAFTCSCTSLYIAAVTRRVPWPASNASTATCEYRFLQVSFHTLPALQLRQLHVALTRSHVTSHVTVLSTATRDQGVHEAASRLCSAVCMPWSRWLLG
jgi:hypothetical protein